MAHNKRHKLPENPRYRKQVKTFTANNGRDAYSRIGSRGGKPTPASFDSERGRQAAKIGWEKRRARAQKELNGNNQNEQSTEKSQEP